MGLGEELFSPRALAVSQAVYWFEGHHGSGYFVHPRHYLFLYMNTYRLRLGSGSPRRRELLQQLGWKFDVVKIHCHEDHPADLLGGDIAAHLALKKSLAFQDPLAKDEVLLTADTVVWLEGKHLAKPDSLEEAKQMLRALSGKTHEVITGFCVRTQELTEVVTETTKVHFSHLSEEVIRHYVETYQPLDKAGAYGIQEWIGLVGIQKIEGCYFNVVGLPVHLLVQTFHRLQLPLSP